MTTFDSREKAFENKFAHEGKLEFAVEAKLSRLYGEWAAEQLGLSGDEARTYATSVVEANLEEPGFQDVLRFVRKDFDEKGLDISDHIMEAKLAECLEEAKKLAAQG
ncbi:MAG: DUF1476 family protein [Alphaproteobacteria bacterium]|nr:DUF1476 family protein [Alphaproteobacteria bacterium]